MKTTMEAAGGRIQWPDAVKGIAILWIVYFHFMLAYYTGGYPWPLSGGNFTAYLTFCAPSSTPETIFCFLQGCCAAIMQRGAQGVGVFVVLSGFGLTYSLLRAKRQESWKTWYGKRMVRLFPMYWAAHLIYLVSPLIDRTEPIDWRFLLSFLGDRVFPVEAMFYYLCPPWWFFGLLLELYLVFPLLYRLLQRLGPVKYLAGSIAFTVAGRYLLFDVLELNVYYVQGAFFGSRLWEFATGMAFAVFFANRPETAERRLFSLPAFAAGVLLYLLGDYCYKPGFTYALSDGIMGTGLSLVLANLAHLLGRVPAAGTAVAAVGASSYGLYLLHYPYVFYFGKRLQELSMPGYAAVVTGIVAVIAVVCIPVERLVNRVAGRVLDRRKNRTPA